jgi:tetratricopeptide (TPR) repeat protein
LLVVAAVAAAVYANSIPNGFALDDVPLVRDNPSIRSLDGFARLWSEPYWGPAGGRAGLYRPVTVASFALNRALTGPGAAGFHAVNVLLHVAVCLLVWLAADAISRRRWTATVTALLFALHPLHGEAVANVAGRAELLAALGVLAAWICHRHGAGAAGPRRIDRWRWWAAAAACYALALMSKENAALAPLLFAVDDLQGPAGRPRRFAPYVGYAASLAAVAALRWSALGGAGGAQDVAFLDNPAAFSGRLVRLATAAWIQARYLIANIWPHPLSSDYSFDAIPRVESVGDPRWWVGVVACALPLAAIALGWRRSRVLVVAGTVWVAFMLPASNLVFAAGTSMAERLAYLPSLGVCLLAGHVAAGGLDRSGPARKATATCLFLAAAAFGVATVSRNPAWDDNATLALTDVRTMPRSAKLQAGAGIALHARGDLDAAVRAYRRALEIYPSYAQVHYNLGELLAGTGDVDGAVRHLERAAQLSPGNPRPYKQLAALLELQGRPDDALRAYEAGARLDPGDLALRFNRGRLLLAVGRRREALEVLEALRDDAPQSLPGRVAGALAEEAAGNEERARARYRELLEEGLPPEIRARVEELLER